MALLDTESGLELALRDDPEPGGRPGHANRLLPMIAELLEQAGSGWEALDLLAVGVGPGTFTGLRIGVATARALARSRGIALAGVSTLRSLALNPSGVEPAATVLSVLDARRGEAFAAAWRINEAERSDPVLAPAALKPDALAEMAARLGPDVLAIGDGAVEFRSVLERCGARVPEDCSALHRVTAVNHCRLAFASGPRDPAGITPEYLRVPDAELTRRTNRTR